VAGVRAAAYAPIHGPTSMVGLLAVGTTSPAVAPGIGDLFPTVLSFAAIASALLGPVLARDRLAASARNDIERIIADHAFRPVFQPVVELSTRRVVGYEALTRFTDGTSPAERFDQAAALDLGPTLELTCMRAAVTAAASLPPPSWLSVNASPALILDTSALETVIGSSRRPIVLEVTEHAAVEDYALLREAVAALRPRIRLAVDDAGAGYAGLRQILELRAEIVKLDLALVRGIHADPARQALIAGMVHFAIQTGCQLLAEGIESEAEADALIELGVDLGQGFLFGRPESP